MPVRLTGSTSGYTELDAPAVAGNNTIKMPASNGAAGQRLGNGATAGTLEYSDNIVSGTAQASTSGTSIDFTGIPSWVKRITVMFSGVSTNSTSPIQIQLGDSGGVEITGYSSVCTGAAAGVATASFAAGFTIQPSTAYGGAGQSYHGQLVFSLLNSSTNTWAASGGFVEPTVPFNFFVNGSKALSSTLDRIRVTTVNGTDTFDAGTINILYE